MKRLFLFFLLIGGAACPTPPNPPPMPPSSTDAPAAATCAAVCAHYAALGCPAAQPTAHGASCETVCQNAQAVAHWNLACRAQAPTCAAADHCETP